MLGTWTGSTRLNIDGLTMSVLSDSRRRGAPVRRIAQPTSAPATAVSARPAIVTASRNPAVCCELQLDAAMSPVNSAARMVPVTAMPKPEATSVAVSMRAAPIVVRFFGRPRSTLTGQAHRARCRACSRPTRRSRSPTGAAAAAPPMPPAARTPQPQVCLRGRRVLFGIFFCGYRWFGTEPPWASKRPGHEILAERVRFELTGLSSSGFQDRRNRPLCHLSAARAQVSLPARAECRVVAGGGATRARRLAP